MEIDTIEDNHKDSTSLNSAANSLLQDLLCRRKHYETNCRHIATRRDDLYKEIPINRLVPLVFHTTPSLLENFQDIDAVAQVVSKQYKSDLFSDWQKYCKALDSQQRAVATFEGAIFFAAESIPWSKEREAWISSCLIHLRSLKRLSNINESDGSGRKRKRGTAQGVQSSTSDRRSRVIGARSIETTEASATVNLQAENALSVDSCLPQTSVGLIHDQGIAMGKTSPGGANFSAVPQAQSTRQVEASETNIAMMAEVDKLESTLGGYLFKGMNATLLRKGEEDGGMRRFTDTVHLHLPYQEGEDFRLEVWLCSSIGKAISQAKMGPVEDLRSRLGDYLYEAMKTSNWRKEDEKTGVSECAGAVNVSFPHNDDNSDCKLEVMLNFGMGMDVYANIYPRVG